MGFVPVATALLTAVLTTRLIKKAYLVLRAPFCKIDYLTDYIYENNGVKPIRDSGYIVHYAHYSSLVGPDQTDHTYSTEHLFE